MSEPATISAPAKSEHRARRWLPLAVIVAGAALFFLFGGQRWLTFETLRDNREALLAFVAARPVLAPLLFLVTYAGATALSVPGGALLTIAAGFLFGCWLATSVVVVGATLGAALLFLAARSALGEFLRERAGPWLVRMEAGFRANAFSYLLVLRLVPLFPFFIVNLVPAFLGVPLRTYVMATLIGIIPGTFVFASVGAGLGSVFDAGGSFSPSGILTPQVLVALIGLALLALVPVVYQRYRR
jgi:uncharacterized membrane protein YdjX (TVP38/TMEM64 family)